MAYLPATRAVDTVGMDPMFYGRVSGVGSVDPYADLMKNITSTYTGRGIDPRPDVGSRLQVCPPVCPEGYVPPGQSPPTIPIAKPTTGGASALPLLIGAAFLLLA